MDKTYRTISGHLKGQDALNAFIEAIKAYSGQSEFVAEAVTEKLIRDGWMSVSSSDSERSKIISAVEGLANIESGLAERVLELLAEAERSAARESAGAA